MWQGHSWSDIQGYTLRQMDAFVRAAHERMKRMYEPTPSAGRRS